jgi:hypothetical protein
VLVLNKENNYKYKILLEHAVASAFQELLSEVEAQHIKQIKAGLSSETLHEIAAKIELIRNLKTYEQVVRKNG